MKGNKLKVLLIMADLSECHFVNALICSHRQGDERYVDSAGIHGFFLSV